MSSYWCGLCGALWTGGHSCVATVTGPFPEPAKSRPLPDLRRMLDITSRLHVRDVYLLKSKLAAIAAWLLIIDQNWGEMDAQQGHETDRIRKIIDATTMAELEALVPDRPSPVAPDDDAS